VEEFHAAEAQANTKGKVRAPRLSRENKLEGLSRALSTRKRKQSFQCGLFAALHSPPPNERMERVLVLVR